MRPARDPTPVYQGFASRLTGTRFDCRSSYCMLPAGMLKGPNNASFVMRLRCEAATALQIADIIVERFDPADTAAAAFEETVNGPDLGPWVVEAYFGAAPDEGQVRALVASAAGNETAQAVRFGRVEACDWVAHSLEGLAPVRVGRFLVHGGHDRGAARAHEIAIEIEAALAFGTGHHGSTRGCLALINRIAKRRRPRAVVDVGTGTGVLAIAVARTFHISVRAGDIDPIAVATAKANAKRNRTAVFVRPVQARGINHRALESGATYDLVIANILAAPLRKLAPVLAKVLAPGGEIILSGLLPRDVQGVISAYRMQKIALVGRFDVEGWATLLMCRPRLRNPSSSALRFGSQRTAG
jgi:ribosomal protein L11 methyltransferase